MDIYSIYKKVPGGIVLIPMFIMALVNTFAPNLVSSFGGATVSLFKTGTVSFAALILFFTGTDIKLENFKILFKRCSVLILAKILFSFVFGFLYVKMFGLEGILGVNAIAFVVCIASCNPGVFLGLILDYGDRDDKGNFPFMNVLSMPCFAILILNTSSGIEFDWMSIITVLVPFVLGIIIGNLDDNITKMGDVAVRACLPFMGFCFGSSINFITAFSSGFPGIALSVMYILFTVPFLLLVERLINKRPGYCAVSWCSIAGFALTVPPLLEDIPYFEPYCTDAMSQISLALIITCLVCPYLTKLTVKIWGSATNEAARKIGQ